MGTAAIINHCCPRCSWPHAFRDFDEPSMVCPNCGLVTPVDNSPSECTPNRILRSQFWYGWLWGFGFGLMAALLIVLLVPA